MVPIWSQSGPKMVPKWFQNGSKVVPKWSQNASLKVKNITLDVILSYDMDIFFTKYLITHITKG